MNLKVVLIAGALGLSGQAALAATDTSCNPFARGENCNGGSWGSASVAGSSSAIQRAVRSFSASSQSQGIGQYVSQAVANVPNVGGSIGDLGDNGSSVDLTNGSVPTDISAVPVPAAGFLLLAGLGGLVALRRKKS